MTRTERTEGTGDAGDTGHVERAERTPEAAEDTLRRARFGALPERIPLADTVEERPATPRDPARDAYDPDEFAVRYGL